MILDGIRCPACGAWAVAYNGNYFCAAEGRCTWALSDPPERHRADGTTYHARRPKAQREWYALAYTTYMQQTGHEPDSHVVRDILEGWA